MKRAGIGVVAFLAMALWGVTAQAATTTINFDNAPTGAHLSKSAPNCTVSATLVVTCNSYQIAGVGNTNATANLTSTYSATVDCNNPGNNQNNPIESHETTFSVSDTSGQLEPKNGKLTVPGLSVTSQGLTPTEEATLCPNPNWRAVIRSGTLTLTSFTYTVTFEGFTDPAIEITGP